MITPAGNWKPKQDSEAGGWSETSKLKKDFAGFCQLSLMLEMYKTGHSFSQLDVVLFWGRDTTVVRFGDQINDEDDECYDKDTKEVDYVCLCCTCFPFIRPVFG